MLGQNHRSSLSILHGWMEYFWLYSGDRQHRWHRYGRLDGGLSGIPDTSASSTGLSYWSHLKAHQSCQRHSEVTLCSNRLTTGLVQYWSLVRYELMYNDNNVLLWIFGMIIINMYLIFFFSIDYLHLCHHWHDIVWTCQAHWCPQWSSKLWDIWSFHAIALSFDDFRWMEWRFGTIVGNTSILW